MVSWNRFILAPWSQSARKNTWSWSRFKKVRSRSRQKICQPSPEKGGKKRETAGKEKKRGKKGNQGKGGGKYREIGQ